MRWSENNLLLMLLWNGLSLYCYYYYNYALIFLVTFMDEFSCF